MYKHISLNSNLNIIWGFSLKKVKGLGFRVSRWVDCSWFTLGTLVNVFKLLLAPLVSSSPQQHKGTRSQEQETETTSK
jgi:hypothetical protein